MERQKVVLKMYKIKVVKNFSGAHRLRNYKGKCEALHGHNWKVEVSVSGNKLDKADMLYDFTLLKKLIDDVLIKLDHKYLNGVKPFDRRNPTSENIARYIFDKVSAGIMKQVKRGLAVSEVTVWETETSAASYSGR